MTYQSDTAVAAAMLHKTIVENASEFRSAQTVDEHLRLYQRCRMHVEWWKTHHNDVQTFMDQIVPRAAA